MRFELVRPDCISSEAWDAIEYYRGRLAAAAAADDRPGVIGAAKELIECVARCVLAATERQVGDNEDFNGVIKAAQKALERVAGRDVGSSEEVRVISGAAQTIVTRANLLRNRVGTGHGRARLADIDDEMAEIAGDAAMLWGRWALRRLRHLTAQYPTRLLSELASGAHRERCGPPLTRCSCPSSRRTCSTPSGWPSGGRLPADSGTRRS